MILRLEQFYYPFFVNVFFIYETNTSRSHSGVCIDIDECVTTPTICNAGSVAGTCFNLVGSFACSCPTGKTQLILSIFLHLYHFFFFFFFFENKIEYFDLIETTAKTEWRCSNVHLLFCVCIH